MIPTENAMCHFLRCAGFLLIIYCTMVAHAQKRVKAGDRCDLHNDRLFLPDNDQRSRGIFYLKCQLSGAGLGNEAYWQKLPCPKGFKFVYSHQECIPFIADSNQQTTTTTTITTTTTAATAHAYEARPGESCGHGERCTGESYCNADSHVCTCPDGRFDRKGFCVQRSFAIARPGESCTNGAQCSGNSFCVDGLCECVPPLKAVGFQCVEQAVSSASQEKHPGESCDRGQRCGGLSICSALTGLCTCPVGTIQYERNCISAVDNTATIVQQALEHRKLSVGESCTINNDCIAGAYCSSQQFHSSCQCLSTHVQVQGTCYKIVQPGHSGCKFNEQCSAAFSGATCVAGVCKCPSEDGSGSAQECEADKSRNSASVKSKPHHLKKRNTEELVPCAFNALDPCPAGADCVNGLCLCSDGSKMKQRSCVQALGGSCSSGQHCEDSICTSAICRCRNGEVEINGKCRKADPRNPGDACDDLSFCSGDSECLGGLCKCSDNMVLSNGKVCVKPAEKANPGEDCSFGSECQGGSHCAKGVCRCPPHQSVIGNVCRIAAANPGVSETKKPGEWCTSSTDKCNGGSVCTNSVCICPQGTLQVQSECMLRTTALPQERCNATTLCEGGSSCEFGLCRCPNGHTIIQKDTCKLAVQPALPTQFCSGAKECVGGSFCSNNICSCQGTQTAFDDNCEEPSLIALPGQPCSNSDRKCVGGSHCLNVICTCPGGSIHTFDRCQKSSLPTSNSKKPGDLCITSEPDSCGKDAQCEKGICECINGYVELHRNCVPSFVVPGDECVQSAQICIGEAKCTNGYCRCADGLTLVNKRCVAARGKATIGEKCEAGQICDGGSSCQQGFCSCPRGTKLQANRCIASLSIQNKALPLQSCTSGELCTRGSECIDNICKCSEEKVFLVSKQLCLTKLVQVGAECRSDQQSCMRRSSCVSRICRCGAGETNMGSQCRFLPSVHAKPGEDCSRRTTEGNSYVCVGGSSCVSGVCKCPLFRNNIVGAECVATIHADPSEDCSQSNAQCVGNSVCNKQRGLCECPNGYSLADHRCLEETTIAFVGDSCASTSTICTGGSICGADLKCVCKTDEVVVDQRCQALLQRSTAKPGEACNEQTTCNDNAKCVAGRCGCARLQTLINFSCQPMLRYPGESCHNYKQVCLGRSSCQSSRCVCQFGFIVVQKFCLELRRVAFIGSYCDSTKLCLGGSRCLGNRCICPTETVAFHGQCIPYRPY